MRRRVRTWTEGPNPRLVAARASTRVDARPPALGTVVGLDLSLTASAMVALPLRWQGDLSEVRTRVVGHGLPTDAAPRARVERYARIADDVFDFCREHQARHVYAEAHAYGASGARASETIEMTGAVKLRLFDDWGVVVFPVVASSARKTLLQKLPSTRGQKKGFLKAWVGRNVRRLGGETEEWTDDEVDAFVVVNHGLMIQGGVALTFLGE